MISPGPTTDAPVHTFDPGIASDQLALPQVSSMTRLRAVVLSRSIARIPRPERGSSATTSWPLGACSLPAPFPVRRSRTYEAVPSYPRPQCPMRELVPSTELQSCLGPDVDVISCVGRVEEPNNICPLPTSEGMKSPPHGSELWFCPGIAQDQRSDPSPANA